MKEEKTPILIVKHFPSELSQEERENFLKHFGAVAVRSMPDNGRLKFSCFATFLSQQAADVAISRLHQLDLLGHRLTAEYAKPADEKHAAHISDFQKFRSEDDSEKKFVSEKDEINTKLEEVSRKLHGIAPSLGLKYLPSPLLKYKYPPPSPTIIANISNCLIAVPKFYVQVLHLMNKMNLPAPFAGPLPAPPLQPEIHPSSGRTMKESEMEEQFEEEEMEVTEDESELESEGDETQNKLPPRTPLKRPSTKISKKAKKLRLKNILHPSSSMPSDTNPTSKADLSGVFEVALTNPLQSSEKKIQIHVKGSSETETSEFIQKSEKEEPRIEVVQAGGFGLIVATRDDSSSKTNAATENEDDEWWNNISFIPVKEIRRNCISSREMSSLSVYKNYEAGEPASRLYLKNLSKQTTEKDLYSLYGQYIDSSSDVERNMFDVRLMQEGRMKGQAFITLANDEQATRALKDTNGYVLHGKPVVVQFARSAKPKEKADRVEEK